MPLPPGYYTPFIKPGGGPRTWSMSRDQDGHRTYKIKFLVQVHPIDGPLNALSAPGLPQVGDIWLIANEFDTWASCKQPLSVVPVNINEPNFFFEIEYTFSTKPDELRCKKDPIEDPLLIPDRISGSFVKYQQEASTDRFGRLIRNSAFEMLHGPQVEFDANRLQIKIEQNVVDLQAALVCKMADCVNDSPLWGLPARTVKLSHFSFDRKFWAQCEVYYTRILEFDVRYSQNSDGTFENFDRNVIDEGTKILHGHWGAATGQGCTLNIVASGGITSATIANGGSKYPINASVNLKVVGGGGAGGLVVCSTNGAGVVTAFVSVTNPGAGYSNTNGVSTSRVASIQEVGWTLDNIGGGPPSPNNPLHFDRAKDRQGENMRIVLNGQGLPANVPIGTGGLYISLINANKNKPLSDNTSWWPINIDPRIETIPEWEDVNIYNSGDLVWVPGDLGAKPVYVATMTNPLEMPGPFVEGWAAVGADVTNILYSGLYNAAVTYITGNFVKDTSLSGPGVIHIEKYPEANFLLLGIPITF